MNGKGVEGQDFDPATGNVRKKIYFMNLTRRFLKCGQIIENIAELANFVPLH